jgi:hypothetical protein
MTEDKEEEIIFFTVEEFRQMEWQEEQGDPASMRNDYTELDHGVIE